jgi:ABC-type transport system substrate-binding protein
MELGAASVTLDPRQWQSGTAEAALGEKLGALVFDRLVSLDNYGRFQPQLASSWSRDAEAKRWQFNLRAGVVFSDGSPVIPADVVAALAPILPNGRQILAGANSIAIESASPMTDLLEELASGRYFIFRASPSGELIGTGPFVVSQWNASGTLQSRSTFVANERAWSGRPFLDAIEIVFGVAPARQLIDLQVGKADLSELTPDLMQRAEQARLRTWSSQPVELVALVFDGASPAVQDARLREALSVSIDRATMAGVLLQKQAEPAAALLPGWLTGYAFLFHMETNPDRVRELRAAVAANAVSAAGPLRLGVEAAGDLSRLLAERVAVNARQAGFNLQVIGHAVSSTATSTNVAPDVRLICWRVSSLSPRAALDSLAAAAGLSETPAAALSADPGQLYRRERATLDSYFVIPLVYLPESLALGSAVCDWMPSPWGEWHLETVWLDRPTGAAPQNSPAPAAPQGARP